MTQGFALTTPLFYVNALPHIGSAYPTMVADAVARYYRLRGLPVRFITGTDEHGAKIERTAAERHLAPAEHCAQLVASFEDLWQKLSIRYDAFIRTTAPAHAAIVREFFERVFRTGDIYKGRYTGLYCVGCEEFKKPEDLEPCQDAPGVLCCPLHRTPVREQDEENWIFALSRYQEKLERHYAEHPQFIQPDHRRTEVLNFVRRGLEDFSISRANVSWGLPVPGDADQTIYVWFDALLGYVTALLEPGEAPTLDNALSRWWPVDLHLIGKDILRFHAVYWPAMLLSAGLPLPKKVFAHGFVLDDRGRKMSKSLGNVVDPAALAERFGADAVRYYFLRDAAFGDDLNFGEQRFKDLLNADLANDLGNLLNRSLGLLVKNAGGQIPDARVPADDPLRVQADALAEGVAEAIEALQFSLACDRVMAVVRAGNKYIATEEPWKLFKQGERQRAEAVLYNVLECVRLAAVLLSPLIPGVAADIYRQLGFSDQAWENLAWSAARWGGLPAGQSLAPGAPVFPRLD